MGNRISYGYKMQDGKMQKNEEQEKVVKMIFDKYLSGESIKSIRDWLNQKGIPSKTDKTWTHSAVGNLLKNQKYLGDEIYTPIIENDIFQKVQNRIANRQEKMGKTNLLEAKNTPYHNLIYCEKNSFKYFRQWYKPKQRYEWKCEKWCERKGHCDFCLLNNTYVLDEEIQQGFLSVTNVLIGSPNKILEPPIPKNNLRCKKLNQMLEDTRENCCQTRSITNLLLELSEAEYELLTDGSDEMIKKYLGGRNQLEQFDGELLRQIIKRVYVCRPTLTFEFINKQKMKITL